MRTGFDLFSFLVVSVAGWLNQRQQQVIEYLVEENRVLREQIGNTRMRFNDDQRRRLAAKAKKLGRKVLAEVAAIVPPETLLAWHRRLKGCRGSVALRQMAQRRFPHEHPFWDEHVSRCSPCYAEFLVERDRVLQKWDRKERLFKFVVTIVATLALAIHRLFR